MTIKLASARIDENGRAVNGKAGDQTGKELCQENAYIWSGGWDCCIRIKNKTKRDKYIKFIKWACNSALIGYDQNQRLTLYNALKAIDFDYKKLTKKVECDCSSLVACGLIVAGFTKISPKATTHYNKDIDTDLSLMKTMKKNYPNSFTYFDSKYKNGNHTKKSRWWRNGDILIKYGHHVVTVTSGGNVPSEAVKAIPDISHYHPVSNWAKVKSDCSFMISKATQGTSFVDSTLDSFIKGCEKNKIPYYLYTYLNKGNELAQAKFMVKTCKGKVGSYFRGYILDVEANNSASNVKEALTWLSKQSDKCMIYTGYSSYAKYKSVIDYRPSNCAWWEARYGQNNGYYDSKYPCHNGADLHQYTSQGKCEGIKGSGKVDLNMIVSSKKKLSWFINK